MKQNNQIQGWPDDFLPEMYVSTNTVYIIYEQRRRNYSLSEPSFWLKGTARSPLGPHRIDTPSSLDSAWTKMCHDSEDQTIFLHWHFVIILLVFFNTATIYNDFNLSSSLSSYKVFSYLLFLFDEKWVATYMIAVASLLQFQYLF